MQTGTYREKASKNMAITAYLLLDEFAKDQVPDSRSLEAGQYLIKEHDKGIDIKFGKGAGKLTILSYDKELGKLITPATFVSNEDIEKFGEFRTGLNKVYTARENARRSANQKKHNPSTHGFPPSPINPATVSSSTSGTKTANQIREMVDDILERFGQLQKDGSKRWSSPFYELKKMKGGEIEIEYNGKDKSQGNRSAGVIFNNNTKQLNGIDIQRLEATHQVVENSPLPKIKNLNKRLQNNSNQNNTQSTSEEPKVKLSRQDGIELAKIATKVLDEMAPTQPPGNREWTSDSGYRFKESKINKEGKKGNFLTVEFIGSSQQPDRPPEEILTVNKGLTGLLMLADVTTNATQSDINKMSGMQEILKEIDLKKKEVKTRSSTNKQSANKGLDLD